MDEGEAKRLALSAAFGGGGSSGYRASGGNGADWSRDRGEVFYRLEAAENHLRKLQEEIQAEFREYRAEFGEHREKESEQAEKMWSAISGMRDDVASMKTRVALMVGGVVFVIELALRLVAPLVAR